MRRTRSPLLLAVIACLLVSVCSAEPPPKEIEIAIFAGGYGLKFFEDAARQFEKQRPGVRVNLYGDPRINDKVRVRVLEGTYPNATDAYGLPWFNLIKGGKVLDLAQAMEGPNWEGDAKWKDSFLPGALDQWRDGDHIWAVPFAYATYAIFYNKRMFREHGWKIPRTWDELFALCDQVKRAGVAPFAFPGVYMYYADMILNAAHYNLVGPKDYMRFQMLEPGTRSDPRYKRAAATVQRLAMEDFQNGWEGMSHTAAQLQFFQGHTAMMANGSWLVSEMQDKIPEDFELGAFRFPVYADGVGDPTALNVGSGYYFLLAPAPHREIAVDFFRFLTSRERATVFAREQDTPTAVRGVPETVYSARMRDVAKMIEASHAAYGAPPGVAANFPGMGQAFNDARFKLLTGKFTPEQFGDFLEAAAARERGNAVDPNRVVYRHWLAGSALLLVMLVAVLYSLWSRLRRSSGHASARPLTEPAARMRWSTALLFVGPALALYLFFSIKPCVQSFGWALTQWDGITSRKYVGLLHFKRLLFESDVFWTALKNNLFVMFVPALFVIPLSLLFAYLISRGVWGNKVFRVCFFFPNILGGIAVTLLWMNAYDPQGGLVNGALVGIGNAFAAIGLHAIANWFLQFRNFAWLSQDHLYWALVPMTIWGACGFNMILYLAAMESVDTSLYEAAAIDGANALQQFFRITIPMIWEVLIISAVFMVIGGMKVFDQIWLMTNQEPTTTTHVIGTLMVSTMFGEFKVGEATAIAVILFVLVFFGTMAVMRLMKREAVEQ
ncbi:MAG TPA: extracellular solute-binding protein [Verrucomicrobiae bacterium]|nr:extracellular solute-binding protein [Verrucomicrobiae bacterium]